MPRSELVRSFVALVERDEFIRAIEEFYAEDATMQENLAPPRRGRAVLVENERQALARHRSITTLAARHILVDGDLVAINWIFDITDRNGRTFRLDELALQIWRGDRIVEERFFYDPSCLTQA